MDEKLQSELNKLGFTIIKKLGEGSFGCVWEVNWSQYPENTYVIKTMSSISGHALESYQNEIESLQKLQNSNIIYIFKHFKLLDFYCIVLEYCSHGNLVDYVRKNGVLKIDAFKRILYQMVQALNACHMMGIAHLDIKPENILLNEYFQVKLSDFGLAVHVQEFEMIKHHGGSRMFCAPERFQKAYDPFKADVWSLGMTCYFLLYGSLPWKVTEKNALTKLIIKHQIQLPYCVDEDMGKLVRMMLTKEPELRPSLDQLMKHELFKQVISSYSNKRQSFIKFTKSSDQIKGFVPIRRRTSNATGKSSPYCPLRTQLSFTRGKSEIFNLK